MRLTLKRTTLVSNDALLIIRCTSGKSLSFAIARSVFMNGIKPSLFFTKPFEAAYKRLPEELVEKYGLDALKLFNEQIDQIQKQNG